MADLKQVLPADPLTPAGIIETAKQAAQEAEARAASIAAAARAGDETVTQDDLEQAERHASWARIKAVAARTRAASRAAELEAEGWQRLLTDQVAKAEGDDQAEVDGYLADARAALLKAIRSADRRNVAIWQVAQYAAEGKWIPDDVDLSGFAPKTTPGAAYFTLAGRRYEYTPAVNVIRALLRPIKREAFARSGNVGGDWLDGI